MAFSLYDALDKSREFMANFRCKLPLATNLSLVVENKKASGYEIGILRNKQKNPEKLYDSRYDKELPDDLVGRTDMVVYLTVLGLRDYFKMIDAVVGRVEAAMINGIRIGRHPKDSITEVLDGFDRLNEKFEFMIQYTKYMKKGIESYLDETYYPLISDYLGLHNPLLYRNAVRKEIGRYGEDTIQYVNFNIPRESNGSGDDYIYITTNDSAKPDFDLAFGVADGRYYFGALAGALECDSLSNGLYHYVNALSNMAMWMNGVDSKTRMGIRHILSIVSEVNYKYNLANEILLLEKAFNVNELFVFYTNMLRHHMSR